MLRLSLGSTPSCSLFTTTPTRTGSTSQTRCESSSSIASCFSRKEIRTAQERDRGYALTSRTRRLATSWPCFGSGLTTRSRRRSVGFELDQIAVVDEACGGGAGRLLASVVIDWAQDLGVELIELSVWDFNEGREPSSVQWVLSRCGIASR